VIEVRNLSKHYGNHAAVSDVTFRAEKGEILGFLGPNGAGKTTTMRILTCFLPPTSGEARVAGYDILEDSIEVRRRIGYLPENVPLYGDLSVSDYLHFVGKLKGMPGPRRKLRTGDVMEECGISHVSHRTIGKLSKGYRQRVGLAQALLNDPEVLILDEPTVGLDPQQIIEIRELIRNLAGKRTIILSTHILPEVSLICQRVIIINKGRLITVDTPDNLRSRLGHNMVIDVAVRGDAALIEKRVAGLPGVETARRMKSDIGEVHHLRVEAKDNADIRETVSRAIVESGFGLVGLSTMDMSLEDVFVHLVTKEENE
jgi:ABC-2 type transport system ATP-binding protein